MTVEVSTKPFERVFDRIAAGPREPILAIERGSLDDDTDTLSAESVDDEVVVGEFDDDEIEPDPYVPRVERERDSTGVIDVEIDMGYTDTMTDDGFGPPSHQGAMIRQPALS